VGYQFTFLKPQHAYYGAWLEMRRRRAWVWLTMLAVLPGVALTFVVTALTESEAAFAILGVAAFVPNFVAAQRLFAWKCPRCGKSFFVDFFGVHLFTDECRRCDLPLYAPCDPAEQTWETETSRGARFVSR